LLISALERGKRTEIPGQDALSMLVLPESRPGWMSASNRLLMLDGTLLPRVPGLRLAQAAPDRDRVDRRKNSVRIVLMHHMAEARQHCQRAVADSLMEAAGLYTRIEVAATVIALVRAFRQFHWRRCTLLVDGMGRSLRTVCVFVGNNFYDLSHFGGRTRLDEGRLCVYIVKKQTWIGLILLPILIGLGRRANLGEIEAHDVALDGEASVMATPLIYRSRPGALLVLSNRNSGVTIHRPNEPG
jgi:hypothetical protein